MAVSPKLNWNLLWYVANSITVTVSSYYSSLQNIGVSTKVNKPSLHKINAHTGPIFEKIMSESSTSSILAE